MGAVFFAKLLRHQGTYCRVSSLAYLSHSIIFYFSQHIFVINGGPKLQKSWLVLITPSSALERRICMSVVGASLRLSARTLYLGLAGVMILSLVLGIFGMDYLDEMEFAAIPNQPTVKPPGIVNLVVRVEERVLEVYSDGQLYKTYRIAVGKGESPTPIGEWNIVWKDYNWGTGFGSRWMGLNVPWATLILEYASSTS